MARFQNMIRSVARITISRGNGRGAALGIIRLRLPTHPSSAGGGGSGRGRLESEETLRSFLRDALDPHKYDGIISMHLIENDPLLSAPTAGIPSASAGESDWFVLIDASDVNAAKAIVANFADGDLPIRPAVISSGTYRLMWDLSKSDIPA